MTFAYDRVIFSSPTWKSPLGGDDCSVAPDGAGEDDDDGEFEDGFASPGLHPETIANGSAISRARQVAISLFLVIFYSPFRNK